MVQRLGGEPGFVPLPLGASSAVRNRDRPAPERGQPEEHEFPAIPSRSHLLPAVPHVDKLGLEGGICY